MMNNSTWREGHQAALPLGILVGAVGMMLAVIGLALLPLDQPAIQGSLFLAQFVVIFGGSVLAARRANRAVRRQLQQP